MLALQKTTPQSGLELLEVPALSAVLPHEVLVHTQATGICGTDLHIAEWSTGYESMTAAMPVTIGHEFSGIVVKVGSEADQSLLGKHVTARPSTTCGTCPACLTDDIDNCTGRKGIGIGRNGAFAALVAVPETNLHIIPDGLDFNLAALTEPMTVCAEAVDTAQVRQGDRVLVLGPGFIGQGIALLAENAGASEVVIAGYNDTARLQTLNDIGFANTIDLAQAPLEQALAPYLAHKFDCIIEATGVPELVSQTLPYLKKRGNLTVVGIHPRPASIDLTQIVRNHQSIRGSYRSPIATWPRVLDYINANQARIRPLITHTFNLVDIEQGFVVAKAKDASKVMAVNFPM